jgi:hypothetical protein
LHFSPSQQLTAKELLASKIFVQNLFGSALPVVQLKTYKSQVHNVVVTETATLDQNVSLLEISNNASLRTLFHQTKTLNS